MVDDDGWEAGNIGRAVDLDRGRGDAGGHLDVHVTGVVRRRR